MRGQPLRAPFQAPRADLISLTALGRRDGRASETENQRLETQPHVGPSLGKGAHPARATAAEPAHWGLHPVVRISTPPGKAAVTPVRGSVSLLVANRQLWAWLRMGSPCFIQSPRSTALPATLPACGTWTSRGPSWLTPYGCAGCPPRHGPDVARQGNHTESGPLGAQTTWPQPWPGSAADTDGTW